MSTEIKSVIIVGGSGNLGRSIVNEMLKSNLKISVLTREDSTKSFPSGLEVVKTNYTIESLREAFKGKDAVISVLGMGGMKYQPTLIDAASDVGVKWFFPSEFGHNTGSETVRAFLPILAGKRTVVEKLIEKEKTGMSWTAVINGYFFDWVRQGIFLGFNLVSKTAPIFDDGNVPFSVTNTATIGKALVALLSNPSLLAEARNRYIYLASHTITQSELLATLEKTSGEKWKVEHIDSASFIKESQEKSAKGDFSGGSGLIRAMAVVEIDGVANSDFRPLGVWNTKLGLPEESLEEDVKAALAKI